MSRLTCITYPAGHSAYNPIEHAWLPLSNALTSIVIPATLPAEHQPLNRQAHLKKGELENKTVKMLDNASNTLKEYWDNLTYDGNPVIPIPIKSKNESSKYKDHASVEKLVNAFLKNLESNEETFPSLKKEFKFYCRYNDRRRHFVSLMKCQLLKNDGQEWEECRNCEAFRFEKKKGIYYF